MFGDTVFAIRTEMNSDRLEMEEVSEDMKAYQRKTKVLTDMLMIQLTEVKEEKFKCEELLGVLKALKLDKATGLDKISAEVLSDCSRIVLHVMLSAINDIKEIMKFLQDGRRCR